MPVTDLHKTQKQKNRVTMIAILVVIALLFCVTLIKIATQS